MVLDHFRAFIKRPSMASSMSCDYASSTAPSSVSTVVFDQYPFPTNPDRVKKARHGNHPKYLPQPEASVRDVQYFLYTLLTSKNNQCAKKFPEWVLETCMAWDGTGEALRSCSEQQLATLCPYVAIAVGIESKKHRLGAYVPIPARHLIGEVVARFVADKKASERQFSDIQRRPDKEQNRSSSTSNNYAMSHADRTQSMVGTPKSQVRPGTARHNSMQSSSSSGILYMNCPDPSKWLVPDETAKVVPVSSSTAKPASSLEKMPRATTGTMSPPPRPSSASLTRSHISWDNEAPPLGHYSTRLPFSANEGAHGESEGVQHARYQQLQMPASIRWNQVSYERSHDIGSLPSQRHTRPRISVDACNNAFRCSTGGPSAGPPPTPRISRIGSTEGSRLPTSTVPRRTNPTNNAIRKDFGFQPPIQLPPHRYRRNPWSSTIRFSIPEETADQPQGMSEKSSNSDEKMRHDSGAEDTSSASQSLSESSATSDTLSKMVEAIPSVTSVGSAFSANIVSTAPVHAQAWPASQSQGSSAVFKHMTSPTDDPLARSASTPAVLTATSSSNEISRTGSASTPAPPAMAERGGNDVTVTRDEIAAFEAQYQNLLQLAARQSQKAPNRTVRFAEPQYGQPAHNASYNKLRSMSQENLYSSQRPSSPSVRSGSLASMTRGLTLYEIIDAEQRARRS